ncbi:hypothetical protein ATEIFO6365_0004052700 [Aspergillus terreus]|uniref:Uncharacterized protein n=1 Tax=Aspergillus terreus TaxID=33178 RepID=A0A5M3YRM7_ASPTE|nr:hypothetical protein ATETN484_0002055200 [Aspergillus terreus]GFF15408.1 hypothetical protein ATEIFO6365_0004052700 [Aspergillus terreus]
MATTPPPPSTLRIPPTPRHGAGYDQESNSTPPPSFPPSHLRTSPRKAKKQDNEHATLSPPGSGHASPRKQPNRSGRLVAAHSLDGTSGLDGSDPFVTAESSAVRHGLQSFRPTMTSGMLPTPAKTPRKKAVGDVGSTARTLFPPPSGSSSGRKKKKYTGFSLDSFNDNEAQGGSAIQIYTDSRDRIPEVSKSEENPFYAKPEPNASTRASKRRVQNAKRDKEVDDAIQREDGMVYVFRGKKMFRRFTDTVESDAEDEDDDLGLLAARPDLLDSSVLTNARPLTRSSIKPRVLFPSTNERTPEPQVNDPDEEEAATDIEDHVLPDDVAEESEDRVPDVEMQQRPVTPPQNSAIETPASPGATTRSLRPRTKRDVSEHTPTASEAKRKRISPFAGWLRKKETPAVTGPKARKRDAEAEGSPGGPATKRTRGSRAAASS